MRDQPNSPVAALEGVTFRTAPGQLDLAGIAFDVLQVFGLGPSADGNRGD